MAYRLGFLGRGASLREEEIRVNSSTVRSFLPRQILAVRKKIRKTHYVLLLLKGSYIKLHVCDSNR